MSNATDRLTHYHDKRRFDVTSEPRGARGKARRAAQPLSFVIQRHEASHLHYDFRLEWDGVLVSWAVPKGPSLDPEIKRLAVHVEDHPVEYGSFEGRIPAGQYGAGMVAIWDNGTWIPLEDPAKGFVKGHLKFRLQGHRLAGDWILFRAGSYGGKTNSKENWLLRKLPDEFAQPGHDAEHAADMGNATGNTGPASAQATKSTRSAAGSRVGKATSGKKQKADALPASIEPQLATLVETAPTVGDWIYEVKYDGYRMLTRIEKQHPHLFSRTGKSWLGRLPHLIDALKESRLEDVWLDGEIVVLEPATGLSDFQALQQALDTDSRSVLYMVFDVLYWRGRDLRAEPWSMRQQALDELFQQLPKKGAIQRSAIIDAAGAAALKEACRLGLEGLIGKRVDALYTSGRGMSWIKLKCRLRQEFVIGGFSEPTGSRSGLGALLVGLHDENGVLQYAGRVGTGFEAATLERLGRRLAGIRTGKCPFARPPDLGGRATAVHWVKPVLVAEVAFAGWTKERVLRQAAFMGLREDKAARDVHDEVRMKNVETAMSSAPITKGAPGKASRAKAPVSRSARNTRAGAKNAPVSAQDEDVVHGIRISHPERVIFSGMESRKIDLARFYEAVAEPLLWHLKGRPLSLVRCPRGSEETCFFQKHVEDAPAGTHQVSIAEKGEGANELLVVESIEGVIGLVQLGAIEFHTWGASERNIEQPDRITLDLDPDPDLPWATVLEGAQLVRTLLDELKLPNFVKTTGGKGLHIVVPLKGTRGWDEIKRFAKALADHVSSVIPQRFVAKMSKANRRGKIFVDYLRNGREATAVCAFSARARADAPVSVPMSWDELTPDRDIRSAYFNIANVPQLLQARGADPWADYAASRTTLTERQFRILGLF